jgi:hypothetical protein
MHDIFLGSELGLQRIRWVVAMIRLDEDGVDAALLGDDLDGSISSVSTPWRLTCSATARS